MPLSILIIGNSIAGPALASFLLLQPLSAAEKPHITLLERAPCLREGGQNIDIRGAGVNIIRKLGLEGAVRAATTGEIGVQLVDAGGEVWAAFEADRTGQMQTPTSDIEILRGRLAQLLFERCKEISQRVLEDGGKGVECIFGDHVDTLDQDGDKVNVHFAKSGEHRQYDIVVGADGLQSLTRKQIFGQEQERTVLKRLGMYGAFFSLPKTENDGLWRKWYHARGRRGVMLRPSDEQGRMTVFMSVVNRQDDRLEDVAVNGRAGMKEQKELMKEYFEEAGWHCRRIVKEMMSSQDFYYDMVAQVKLDRWSKGRVVLLGDAGYCASPISGMGTTLGLNGGYLLAGAILRHPNDHTAAFEEYETKMRPLVQRAQKLVPGAPDSMNPETEWGVWLMNAMVGFLAWTKLIELLFRFLGPPANAISVEEYNSEDRVVGGVKEFSTQEV